jgi:hypothetical protein
MRKIIPCCGALTAFLFLPAAGAATLCTAQDKNVVVSIHSPTCKAAPCVIKFEAARTAYFEFRPIGCAGGSQDFSIQVAAKKGRASPQLKSCDGNAMCPSSFNLDGATPEFAAQGKTWGRIRF